MCRTPAASGGFATPWLPSWPCPSCAMLGGARSLYAIAQWGREHPELARVLGFRREQTPCVATLHHVFRRLDVDAFEGALSAWAQGSLQEGDEAIAVDGKALRGIHGDELPGVRLVAAYAHRSGLESAWVKRGVRSKRKESERTVAPILLGQLDLSGKVVTGDALYAQRDLSRQVVEQGGSYLWVLKDNQPTVKEAVSLLFAEPPWGEEFSKAGQRGRHGDRQERRRLRAIVRPERLLGVAMLGASLLHGTDSHPQGDKDGGTGLCHHQLDSGGSRAG